MSPASRGQRRDVELPRVLFHFAVLLTGPLLSFTGGGMNPGSIVRCRNRDWVLLPNNRDDLYLLRPLAGATDEVCVVQKRLADLVGYDLPEERIQPSAFPPQPLMIYRMPPAHTC